MARLGIIAGDLPGAIEFGAVLGRRGVQAAIAIGLPGPALPEAEAVAVALATRGVPVGRAVAESLAACEALLAAGARQIVQLVDPGFEDAAIGPVADALMRRLRSGFAAVAPGAPSSGRSVYLGHLFIGTSLAGGEPNLPRRLAAQADAPVALIPFRIMEEGSAAIRREMSRLAEAGRRYAIVDTLTDEHLVALGEAASAQALLVGGPGLALGLAGGAAPHEPVPGAAGIVPHGPGVVLAASAARATIAQLGLARLHCPTLDLEGGTSVAEVLDWALPRLSDEQPLVIAAGPARAEAPGMPASFAEVAEALVGRGVGRLLVAGEAASAAVVSRLGIRQLRLGPEIEPGLPWCLVPETDLHIAIKPGASGGRDMLLRAFGA